MKRAVFISGVLAAAMMVTAVGASAKGWGPGGKGASHMMMNFEEVDANKDGKVSPEEMDAFAKARFEKADTNGDGLLGADEVKAKVTEEMKRKAEMRSARMIEHKDADGDGKLSFEEMQAGRDDRRAKMFGKLDADKDGAISKEEFEQARAMMKERGGKMWKSQGGRNGCNK